jgi:hypothetical protein
MGVDLGAGSGVVVDDLQMYRRVLLHLGEDVEPTPATAPPRRVGRIRDLLELTQHGAEDDQGHVDEAGLGDVEDPAVDDDRGVEQHAAQAVTLLL